MKRCVQGCLVAVLLLFVPGLIEQFEAPKAAVVRVLGLSAVAACLAGGMR